jgi:hypothetical protein
MKAEEFGSFEEFWPHYVKEHSKASTRRLHFLGTGSALSALALGLLSPRRRWLLALAPLVGYGPAWIGHFFFEKNIPATFRHPIWSLRADFVMFGKMLRGTMDDEVERVMREAYEEQEQARDHGTNGNGKGIAEPAPDSHAIN